MGFFKKPVQPNQTASFSDLLLSIDNRLLDMLADPEPIEDVYKESEDLLEAFGRPLLERFLEDNSDSATLPAIEVALKESNRIRLQAGHFTLWLFDIDKTDDFGQDGGSLFLEQAKLPRQFMPEQSDFFQTIREYIILQNVVQLKSRNVTGPVEKKLIGYYYGILDLPGTSGQMQHYFPKNVQDRLLAEIWHDDTKGREQDEVETQGFENPENLHYTITSLEGDPEEVAEGLIRDSLPKTFLNEIDISTDEGFGKLFGCLMVRRLKCSLEKDEIVDFVRKNRGALEAKRGLFVPLVDAMGAMGDDPAAKDTADFLTYFLQQVDYCLIGKEDLINVKSDRLLWLLWALASHLSSDKITYEQAMIILSKPVHKNRISPLSLQFMLLDFADTLGSTSTPPTEYVMLIVECGLQIKNVESVYAGVSVAKNLNLPFQRDAFADLLERSVQFLKGKGKDVSAEEEYLHRLQGRFRTSVSDDDL